MFNSSNKKQGRNLSTVEIAAIDNTMGELLDLAGTDDETVEIIREELEDQFSKRTAELSKEDAIELARRLFNMSIKVVFGLMKTECTRDWDMDKKLFFIKNASVKIEPVIKNWNQLEIEGRKTLVNNLYGRALKEMRDIFIVAKVQVSKEYREDESIQYMEDLIKSLLKLEIDEIADQETVMETLINTTRDFFGDIYKNLLDSVDYKKNNSARE